MQKIGVSFVVKTNSEVVGDLKLLERFKQFCSLKMTYTLPMTFLHVFSLKKDYYQIIFAGLECK